MPRFKAPKTRIVEIVARLREQFPVAICELTHRNPYELLAATILSAQCTDKRVNLTTPALFKKYPSPHELAAADQGDVELLVKSTGFFRMKSQNLIGMAREVCERFGGQVPSALEDLVTLPGVGRKTGNVVRSVDFNLPGLPDDTNVTRLSRRLGLTTELDPVKIEHALGAMLDPTEWGEFSLRLILHGRRTCIARKPACERCVLVDVCPKIGV